MADSEDKEGAGIARPFSDGDDSERRLSGSSRPDILYQFSKHMGEEGANREIMLEMRNTLNHLAEMHYGVTPEEHLALFLWWRDHIAEIKVRKERWEKVRQTVIGYLVMTIIGCIVSIGQPVGKAVIDYWDGFLNNRPK